MPFEIQGDYMIGNSLCNVPMHEYVPRLRRRENALGDTRVRTSDPEDLFLHIEINEAPSTYNSSAGSKEKKNSFVYMFERRFGELG